MVLALRDYVTEEHLAELTPEARLQAMKIFLTAEGEKDKELRLDIGHGGVAEVHWDPKISTTGDRLLPLLAGVVKLQGAEKHVIHDPQGPAGTPRWPGGHPYGPGGTLVRTLGAGGAGV